MRYFGILFILPLLGAGVPTTVPARVPTSAPALTQAQQTAQTDQQIRTIDAKLPLCRRLRAATGEREPVYSGYYDAQDQLIMMTAEYGSEDSNELDTYYYDQGRLMAVEIYFGRFGATAEGESVIYKTTSRYYFAGGQCTHSETDGKPSNIIWRDLNPTLKSEPVARKALTGPATGRPATETAFQHQFERVVAQAKSGQLEDNELKKLHHFLSEKQSKGPLDYADLRRQQIAQTISATGSVAWMQSLRQTLPEAFGPEQILDFATTQPTAFFTAETAQHANLLKIILDAKDKAWQAQAHTYYQALKTYADQAPPGPAKARAQQWLAAIGPYQKKQSDSIKVIISAENAPNRWR